MSLDGPADVVFNPQGRANTQGTQSTFREATRIVKDTLTRAGCPGMYSLAAREKVKWRAPAGNVISLRPSRENEIVLRVRPGDTDSCWEYVLIAGKGVVWEHVKSSLAAYLGGEQTDAPHEVVGEPPLKGHLTLRKSAKTVQEVAPVPPVQEVAPVPPAAEPDVSNVMLKLLAAVQRGETYKTKLAALKVHAEELQTRHNEVTTRRDELNQILTDLSASIETATLEVMSLEETMEADAELKTARQLSTMLASMSKGTM